MGELFVGVLCAVALFLFCYKGKDKIDSILSNVAGFFALGIVTFPTSADVPISCSLRCYLSSSTTGAIHLTMAALFFVTLAIISYSIFTRTKTDKTFLFIRRKGEMTNEKRKRNKIYKVCAIVMIACLVGIGLYMKVLKHHYSNLENIHPVFCLEAIALVAFGFSWLTKGEFLLKDKFDKTENLKTE